MGQDDGGSLSVDEVMETLALTEGDRADIERSFKEVDMNDDGEMDYGEFYQMLQREPEVQHEALDDADEFIEVNVEDEEGSEGSEVSEGSGTSSHSKSSSSSS